MSATRASNDRPPGSGGVKRGRLQQETATTGSRVTVVLGAQWGDEGKGKVVDLLATDADIISRCQVRQGGPPPRQTQSPPSPPTQTPTRLLESLPTRTPSQQPPPPTPTPTQALPLPSLHETPLSHSRPQEPLLLHPAPAPTPAVGQGQAINTRVAELGIPDPQGVGGESHGCDAGPFTGGGWWGPQLP